jgi:curved DNA-binding protein CbpA
MESEYICIDDEYYDPYFILGVTPDDSDTQINKAYKQRAKKYHPDKAPLGKVTKYEKRFNIILESYEFIKRKRQDDIQCTRVSETNLQTFNEEFERVSNPYDFGYGTHERIEKVEDYEKLDYKPVNQFKNRKFSNKTFNQIFMYNKKSTSIDEEHSNKALIHKTSDGFYGFNTADIGNCALVSSFNGLLITGDNLGESGKGYYSRDYSDYKHSYNSAKNPNAVLKVPTTKEEPTHESDVKKLYSQYKSVYKSPVEIKGGSYNQQQEKLLNNVINDLMEKEKEDKDLIMKYNKIYKKEVVKQALEGRLETSPNLIKSIKQHYNAKQIT